MKFLTNVKHHETTCKNTKNITLVNILLELWPFEQIVDIENSHFCYVLMSAVYVHETSHKYKAL